MLPDRVTVKIVGYQHQPIFNLGALTGIQSLSMNVAVQPSVTMRFLLTQPPAIWKGENHAKTEIRSISERGATLVEYAIALSVFLVSMFAVIEFGGPSGRTMLLLMLPGVERDMPLSTRLLRQRP